jgi:hypothetical protein
MESDRHTPDYDALQVCTWCGAPLGQNAMPPQSSKLFCSRSCEIDGTFWIFQELSAIEVTHPQHLCPDPRDVVDPRDFL